MKQAKLLYPLIFLLLCGFSLQAATVTGVISDAASEEPIAGATVLLISGGFGVGEPDTVTATTDAEGTYTFEEVSQGFYSIVVTAAEYISATDNAFVQGENSTSENDISMTPVGGIEGTASVSGTVTNADDDEPIAGATVILSLRSGGGGGAILTPLDTTTSNAEGAYSFTELGEGLYNVQVTAAGFDQGGDNMNLSDGEEEISNIALDPDVPPTGIITGTITDSDTEEPVAEGVKVELIQRTGFNAGTVDFTVLDVTATDADGVYEFTGLESSGFGNGEFVNYSVVVGTDTTNFIDVTNGETSEVNIEVAPDDAIGIQMLLTGYTQPYMVNFSGSELRFEKLDHNIEVTLFNLVGDVIARGRLNGGAPVLNLDKDMRNTHLFLNIKSKRGSSYQNIFIK